MFFKKKKKKSLSVIFLEKAKKLFGNRFVFSDECFAHVSASENGVFTGENEVVSKLSRNIELFCLRRSDVSVREKFDDQTEVFTIIFYV